MEQVERRFVTRLIAFFIFAPFFLSDALAEVGQSFTLDGRLYQSGSTTVPVTDSGSFRIQILGPTEISPGIFCVLYEENRPFNTTASSGYFNVKVGSSVGAAIRGGADSGNSMARVFSNAPGPINGKESDAGAANCTYPTTGGEGRLIRIHVTRSDNSVRTLTPDLAMDSVPTAVVAERAESLQGLSRAQVLELGADELSQSNVENVFSSTNHPRLLDILSIPPANYVRSGGNGAAGVPQISGNPGAGLSAGQFWYDSAANVLKYHNGSGVQILGVAGSGITSITAGTGLTGGTINTSGQTIAVDVGTADGKIVQVQAGGKLPALDGSDLTVLNGSAIQSGTIGGNTSINTTGSITAASSSVAAASLRTLEIFKSDHSAKVTVTASGAQVGDYSIVLPVNDGDPNQVLATNGSGALSWVNLSPAGAASGDLSGNYPNPEVAKIRGFAVATTTPQERQVYFWDEGSSEFRPGFIGIGDLRADGGAVQFATPCNSGSKTMTWSSVTDTFGCTDIGIAYTAVSGLGTAATKTAGTAAGNVLELDGDGKVPAGTLGSNIVVDGGNATSGVLKVGTTSDDNMSLITNGQDRLTILNQGQVGIGTNSPSHLLDVHGNASNSYVARIEYPLTDNLDKGLLVKTASSSGGQSASYALHVQTGARDALVVSSSGNVGIGAGSPQSPLDVTGIATVRNTPTGSLISLRPTGNNGYPELGMGAASGTPNEFQLLNNGYWHLKTNTTANLVLGSNGSSTQMVLQNGGNVGIGTTTPQSLLDVAGVIRAQQICDETGGNCKTLNSGWGGGGDMDGVTTHPSTSGLTGGATSGTADLSVVTDGTSIEVNGSNQVQVKDLGITSGKLAADSVTSAKIQDGTIVNADISGTAAIAWSKIDKTGASASDIGALAPSRQIATASGSGLTGGGDLTADRSLALNVDGSSIEIATNTVQVKDEGIGTAKLAADAVTSAKISDGTIGVVDLNFAGAMPSNTGLVVHDGTQFFSRQCAPNQTLVWTVANGWVCSALVLSETDPKVGSNTTNRLSKWDGSALVTSAIYENSGSVGIGTESPGSRLEVSQGVANTAAEGLSVKNSNGSHGVHLWSDSNLVARLNSYSNGAGDLALNSGGGLVGIGTVTPGYLLDMSAGTAAHRMNSATGNQVFTIYSINGAAQAFVGIVNNGGIMSGVTNGDFAVAAQSKPIHLSTNGSPNLTVATNGHIGVGTSAPNRQLEISSAVEPAIRVASGGSSTSYLEVIDVTATGAVIRKTANTGTPVLDLSANPADGTSGAAVRFFRETNTTGAKYLQVHRGNGTSGVDSQISVGANTYFNVNGGNVGIGTASPRVALDVKGTAAMAPATSNVTTTIDFGAGNLHYTAADCQAFELHNMKDGGSYMFVVRGAASALCSFSAYSDAGANALSVKMPPGHDVTTASKETVYNFVVMGTTVYVAWTPGY